MPGDSGNGSPVFYNDDVLLVQKLQVFAEAVLYFGGFYEHSTTSLAKISANSL
ncbi:hypothetical protein D3C83_126820 [compost metagenome]